MPHQRGPDSATHRFSYSGEHAGKGEARERRRHIDRSRREYQRPTEQAVLPYNYAYGALTGTPSANVYGTTTNTYLPQTNPYVAGLGAYTALQGIGQS